MRVQTTVIEHAVLADALAKIRDERTDQVGFAREVSRAATLLLAAASADFPTHEAGCTTPVTHTTVRRLAPQPCLVPIIRAGLGMLDAARMIFPDAPVAYVGLRRNERTAAAHWYLDALPSSLQDVAVLVLEPMIATGGTLGQVLERIDALKPASITVISLLCAPEGLSVLADVAAHLDAPLAVVTAAIDDGLTAQNFITPGLGDAGDRMYGGLPSQLDAS